MPNSSSPVQDLPPTRDVAEQLRAEREREEALSQLAEVQSLARLGSWTWDVATGATSWTPEMYRIFDREPTRGPAGWKELLAYLHPDDRQLLDDAFAHAFGGDEFDLDYRIIMRNGAERVVHARGRLERHGRYAGTVQEVTSLRATERHAKAAARRFEQTLENAPIGIALVAPDGRWLKANRALCEILGYSEQELLSLRFQQITHPEDLNADLESVRQLLAGEIVSYRIPKRYFHRTGRIVWTELSVSLMRDEGGSPVHFIAQIQDITAQQAAHDALTASERRYHSIAANMPGMVYRFTVTPSGETGFTFVSAGAREIYGLEPDALMADPSLAVERIHPDDLDAWQASVNASAANQSRWEWRGRHLHVDGTVRYLHAIAQPIRETDGSVVWDGVVTDETAMRTAQEHEAQALELFQAAFERAPIGMAVVALDGRFERVNEALCEISGYASEDLSVMAPFAITHPDDADAVAREFTTLGSASDTLALEARIVHAAGHPVWVQARVTLIRDDAGNPAHALAQVLDVTERRAYEERLRHLADHDALTGLLNRRGFESTLERHLASCRRYGAAGALLVIDLDGFKLVNDTLGHGAGDDLIVTCAQALKDRLRETDVIARLGGDEFAVLLPVQTRLEAEHAAQSLIDTVREQSAEIAQSHPGRITASIGIAPFGEEQLTADEMLVQADLAMYEAKEAGKDRYAMCRSEPSAEPRVKPQMTWPERIERALDDERFELHAQPIVDLSTGRIVQHEVLVRMSDERGDLIPPSTFLYVAERYGVIKELDRWIITQAIRQMACLRQSGVSLPLAVNVSSLSACDSALLDAIGAELSEGNVPAGDLTLEIAETAAVADIPRARRFAEALREVGCHFALDDFGAGFGSFYYLKHLPFDVVKIDGELVRHATENAADRLVIKAVADIAHGLGKKTVAELVADEPTIRLLLRHGIDFGQGHYLGRPRPLDEVARELLEPASANSL